MPIINPSDGSGSGGGFPVGTPDNIFGTDTGTNLPDVTIAASKAAAEATRDAYDIANVGWKDSYLNKDLNILLYYADNGDQYVQYQRNVDGTWVDNQPPVVAIKGDQGPAGISGNSYFFSSTTARDDFFNTSGNEALLETNLPILVNRGSTATPFYWTGTNSPPSYDSTLFHPTLVGTESYEIFDVTDLEKVTGYSGGIITIPNGVSITLIQTSSFLSSSVEFVLEGTAELRITSNLANAIWNYTGTGTFLSQNGIRVSLNNVIIFSSSSPSTFIDTKNCTLNINETAIAGFNDLGRMVGTGITLFGSSSSFISQFDTGLNFDNMVHSINSIVITSSSLVGDAFIITNNETFPLVSTFNSVTTQLQPQNNVFYVDPVASNNKSIQVSGTNVSGDEGLFNTSGGITGSFTSVTDSSVSIGITSVQDDGNGNAQFNLAASPDSIYVGEIVTISGYTINTNYNGTFVVTSVPVAGSFTVDTSFGTTEVGGQVDADVVTLSEISTTISDGDTLRITTDNTLQYDGGATAFNKQTNSFQINRVFDGDATGTWDTSPIDQTIPVVLGGDNAGFRRSTAKTEVSAINNTLVTDVPAVGAKILINTSGWVEDSAERLKVDDKGSIIYTGLEPVTTKGDGNVYLRPESSNNLFLSCQFAKQSVERVSCTFNILNDSITTTSPHNLSVGDNITLNDTEGVIDTALRDDIVYYVESVVSPTEFTISYTLGGALISFSGGSSGNTSYANVRLKGSVPVEPIGSGRPRTLVPHSIEDVITGDKTFLVVSNTTNTIGIVVIDTYYRIVL